MTKSSILSKSLEKIIPKLVVFDLDFTIWDAGGVWCDCTNPPYRLDAYGNVFDQTNRHISLYADVIPILEKLREIQIPVAIASRTSAPEWANQLTRMLGIDEFISYREIYSGSKIEHLSRISKESGVMLEEMLFFDDEHRNIVDAHQIGVSAILVENGLDAELFETVTGIPIHE